MPEDQNLCCKEKAGSVLELKVSQKDRYRIKESEASENEGKISGRSYMGMWIAAVFSIRILEEELQLKGELSVFCLYLSEEGKTDWSEQRVPYEGESGSQRGKKKG